MAATSIPSTTEPFPPLEAAPQTPTSCVSTSTSAPSNLPTISEIAETALSPSLEEPRKPHALQLPALNNPSSLSPKLGRLPYSPARSPIVLTGAAAVADANRHQEQRNTSSRQTTPNPAVEVMQSLMGGGGISRPQDAPNPTMLSEPLRKAAEKIVIPENNSVAADSLQTSPVSMSSIGTADHTNGNGGALTATSGSDSVNALPQLVAEPAEMLSPNTRPAHAANSDDSSNYNNSSAQRVTSASYPGPTSLSRQSESSQHQHPQPQHHTHNHQRTDSQDSTTTTPARGMSLPGLSYNDNAKSSPASSTKRHKCPYCATDFTRHHNLKSHLLTHSQEKPYVCQTCQARFRRLHDLKRHARLHTGERPHTCDKCGRSFARGDALARHNKGTGGCSGHRPSLGGDGDGADGVDGMDGVEYGVDEDGDDSMMDSSARRVSEPSRKRIHLDVAHGSNSHSPYRQHSSTYPPGQHRPGEMGPPVMHPSANSNSNQSTSPRDANAPSYYPGFGQHTGGMTESPKPLSPGQPADSNRLSIDAGTSAPMARNRSPSLTTQFQQTHFGRGNGGRTPPQPSQFQNSTQLPPLSLGAATSRPPLHSNLSGPGPSLLHHQQVPSQSGSMSNPASASSYGQSSGSSMREILAGGASAANNGNSNGGGGEADLWAHLRQLEGKFSRMQDEYELRISRLQEEVISLRGQLNSVTGAGAQGSSYSSEPRY